MSNYISAVLSKTDYDEIMDLLSKLNAKLTFSINLSPEHRDSVATMSDGRLPFVQKSLNYGKLEPKIAPDNADIIELEKDINFFSSLSPVEMELKQLAEKVITARIAAGADAFETARNIYINSQRAAKQGVPGTQLIYDDLKILFEGQGSKKIKK